MDNRKDLRPDRDVVLDIAKKVARRAGLDWQELFAANHKPAVVCARAEAMCLIRDQTKCSFRGLAEVWGTDGSGVCRLIAKHRYRLAHGPKTAPRHYVAQYMATLRFLYPDRAERMIAGTDPKLAADLASWKSLGARRAA